VQEERVRDARARHEAGIARPLDVYQSEAQASQTRVQLLDAPNDARAGRAALAFLTGAPVEASPLTDGAAAVVLMAEERAAAEGRRPLARITGFTFVAQDPGDELLLGPAYAAPRLLARHGLTLADIDVIEIHEAFAGQVLAVLRAWGSAAFGREALGLPGAFGEVDLERVNPWGGSVSLGHPFGATGARLVTTAAHRLHVEDGRFALVTACAAGGQGHAMLLERVGA